MRLPHLNLVGESLTKLKKYVSIKGEVNYISYPFLLSSELLEWFLTCSRMKAGKKTPTDSHINHNIVSLTLATY